MKNVTVLILAGGRSERMGVPKPFLLRKGRTFIENIAEGYQRFGVNCTALVLNHQFIPLLPAGIPGLKLIPNYHPEYERLYSLKIGLKQLSGSDHVFVHNVDNPFVEQDVLMKMWAYRSDCAFVVPALSGRNGHPVLLPKNIVRHIISLDDGLSSLKEILQQFKKVEVETGSEKIFSNINTWKDYEENILELIPEYYCD